MELLTKEEVLSLRTQTHQVYKKYNCLRLGQCYFNELLMLNEKGLILANMVRGTENDPFHNDNILPKFFLSICDTDAYNEIILKFYPN